MRESTEETVDCPGESAGEVLEVVLREGARKLLQRAIEEEVEDFFRQHSQDKGEDGRRLAVRNGYMLERQIFSSLGPIRIKQPRVDDGKLGERRGEQGFWSRIQPRYLRRIPSVDNLMPALHLKGISTGDLPRALQAILGEGAKGLSTTNVVRPKKIWEAEYEQWANRDLRDKEYVYFWVDGIYFNVRLEDDLCCMLVIMGADREGRKKLVAVSVVFRDSKLSWKEILLTLKRRGLRKGPRAAIGDGSLGFWAALPEVYPPAKEQLCWVHKTANVLDKLPKRLQPKAKAALHGIYGAENKQAALETLDQFVNLYQDKYPKALQCLSKDKDRLFTFYDFPAAHWIHIRTINPIESAFATVRHRTRRTKGCGSPIATLTMVFKLAKETERTWKRRKGYKQILLVLQGIDFVDGEMKEAV
jgi:putative transposase